MRIQNFEIYYFYDSSFHLHSYHVTVYRRYFFNISKFRKEYMLNVKRL